MKIVGITGPAGAGKDTVADYLCEHHGYVKYALAAPIKTALNALFGWPNDNWDDREWKETLIDWLGRSPRNLAQTLGTEWGRECVHPELWLLLAEMNINAHTLARGVVIPDIRFENEAAWLRDRMGGQLWHVYRPKTKKVEAHSSENGVRWDHRDRKLLNCWNYQRLYEQVDYAAAHVPG